MGLLTDASSTAIGASLMQRVGKNWCPLAFFSKKLSSPKSTGSSADTAMAPGETTWPAYCRELLAIYEAIQHLHHIPEAQHCTI